VLIQITPLVPFVSLWEVQRFLVTITFAPSIKRSFVSSPSASSSLRLAAPGPVLSTGTINTRLLLEASRFKLIWSTNAFFGQRQSASVYSAFSSGDKFAQVLSRSTSSFEITSCRIWSRTSPKRWAGSLEGSSCRVKGASFGGVKVAQIVAQIESG
jgi:hypothetical protein